MRKNNISKNNKNKKWKELEEDLNKNLYYNESVSITNSDITTMATTICGSASNFITGKFVPKLVMYTESVLYVHI